MTQTLWILIAVQIAMGAFDTLFHHELTERLAWRPSQRRELKLHGVRNLIYALLFVAIAWVEPDGLWADAIIVFLAVELVITLKDFVEEDRTRKLPASERINHTLLALNYGAILALLLPLLLAWSDRQAVIVRTDHGVWSLVLSVAALGVAIFGLRDLFAASRLKRLVPRTAGGLVTALPQHSTVLVTGATGFVGSRLTEALAAGGHRAIVLTRNPSKALKLAPPFDLVTRLDQIAPATRIDAIVHLAGESISGGLWTKARRQAVIRSRVDMTNDIAALVARLEHRPRVLIAASAVGWYGIRDDEPLTEAAGFEPCFSHESCAICEDAAMKVERLGVRVVNLRIGLVLGREGGLLARLLLPFEFGLGGMIGSGRQWMSWIERDDLVRLIAHAISSPVLEGPVNATAPAPVRNAEFTRELAHALHRPAFMRVPAVPCRVLGGDFARELLLGGQFVMPHKALASGFSFRHTEIRSAFDAIFGATAKRKSSLHLDAAERLKFT